MNKFEDHVSVVTGASSGIGRAIALRLAALGAIVCMVGRKMEALIAVTNRDRTTSDRFHCYQADLMLGRDVHRLVRDIQEEFHHIDILVHSAGTISMGRFEESPVTDFDRQFRVNVRAPYVITQSFLPSLKARKGQIVFVNSSVGLANARANVGQYSATKHALKALADSLRDEVNSDGIRVLSIYPGRTATPMQEKIHKMEGKEYDPKRLLQSDDIADVVISVLSLPRTAEVTDISVRPFIKSS
jgi:NADP-dependent 3-hydroxy acid dehydrogenase YdfG